MKKSLFLFIFSLLVFLSHAFIIQEAFYLKPIDWYLLVWFFDLTVVAINCVQIFMLLKLMIK